MEGPPHKDYVAVPEFDDLWNDGYARGGAEYSSSEDPDFTDLGNELDSERDDNLYKNNVTDGIEVGSNVGEPKDVNEHDVQVDVEIADLEKKGQVTMTCSSCGVRGHNKRRHSMPHVLDVRDFILQAALNYIVFKNSFYWGLKEGLNSHLLPSLEPRGLKK
ncbi:Hypothetical predicted protein [Olea europaea subsp. europaea]|uniref:Uncharacterized protein n=1 Tax=Olea europaea subsp. europaea TaxID=158383 RepID=A0A8S0TE01_OLEEU|nr:Hypothetical predicted protein [Olea europaea subsp. europaea]